MSDLRAVILASMAVLLLAPAPADASHKRYPQDVRETRHWLKRQVGWHQWQCLDTLWLRESHWRVDARGPLTSHGRAYGIPQALPGKKMRSMGKGWRHDPMLQGMWGRRYIRSRYDDRPCTALRHQDRHGWY